jgi:hypothetical protein
MECLVEPVERLGVRALERALLRGEVGLQLLEVAGLGALGGQPDGAALERLAHEGGVGDRVRADQRDEGAELGHDRHQALVAKARQRLAHRRAAHAQPVGQLVLRQAPARLELGAHDGLAQRNVDLIASRPAAHPSA